MWMLLAALFLAAPNLEATEMLFSTGGGRTNRGAGRERNIHH